MISCTQADLLLDGLLDGGLQGHERHAVEEHLAACAACRATLQGLRDLQAAARSAPRAVPPPAGTWAAVAAQRPTALRRRVTLPAWALAAAAALLLVAGASVAAWLSRPAPPPVVVAGTGVLPPELADLECLCDGHEHALARERLLDEIERSEPGGLHGVGDRAVAGDHGHRQRFVHFADLGERLQPAHPRHLDVEDDEMRHIPLDDRDAFRA